MQMNDNKMVLTVSEVSKKLGLSRNSTYEGLRRGEIPYIRVGKRLLIPKAALDNLLSGAEGARSEKIPGSSDVNL